MRQNGWGILVSPDALPLCYLLQIKRALHYSNKAATSNDLANQMYRKWERAPHLDPSLVNDKLHFTYLNDPAVKSIIKRAQQVLHPLHLFPSSPSALPLPFPNRPPCPPSLLLNRPWESRAAMVLGTPHQLDRASSLPLLSWADPL